MEGLPDNSDIHSKLEGFECSEEYPDFEAIYGPAVADLWMQRRIPCHDTREWLESAAAQLTAMIVEDSGLDINIVKQRLNQCWSRIRKDGLRSYIERLEQLN